MSCKLFGTDGIRGIYGETLLGDTAYRLGNALGARAKVVAVGRDTRLSGLELYKYLRKGIMDAGASIIDLGVVPTPVVSYVTEHSDAEYGVVITASHNPARYNGLKVFGSNGIKLASCEEDSIESAMFGDIVVSNKRGEEMYGERYIEGYTRGLIEVFSRISGLNVGLDLTNGALTSIAPIVAGGVFDSYMMLNDKPDGEHINEGSGALHIDTMRDAVLANNLDVGFAFDGDGDRIIAISSSGRMINGDMMLYIIAKHLKSIGKLSNDLAIGTLYTNIGVEKSLNRAGIMLERADVGDSNVIAMMRSTHASIGGERAGHIILLDYAPTGDGMLVALYLSKIMSDKGMSLDELADANEYSERSFDIVTTLAHDIALDREIIEYRDSLLNNNGRILMRASGTEPKLRIMVESEDEAIIDSTGNRLVSFIKNKYKL